jgi:hypothetical protein
MLDLQTGEMAILIRGFDTLEKEVRTSGSGAAVNIPKAWRGLRVKIVLLDPLPKK